MDGAEKAPLAELREKCLRAKAVDRDKTHKRIRRDRYAREHTDGEGAWNLHARGTVDDGAKFRAAWQPLVDEQFKTAKAEGRLVSIIAAGERWGDGSLRPCLEDMLGAGAFLSRLPKRDLSPETLAAAAVFEAARPDLESRLMQCGSGRELIAKGFVDDIAMAAQLDSSQACPVLREGASVNL